MNPRTLLQRHHALRWLAPVAVVAAIAAATTGVFQASPPSQTLPHASSAALVAQLKASPDKPYTGTVVSTFSLGLPQLPNIGDLGDGSSFTSLLAGSHTMQVWYGGADRQRVAIFGASDETDLFRRGRSVWQWSSADRSAVHLVLPGGDGGLAPLIGAASAGVTPSVMATNAVNDLAPSTTVKVGEGEQVADRSTYDLTLTPHDADSRVSKVRIAVDGATKVPLGVKIYTRGERLPAVDIAFTSIRFTQPMPRNFSFTPPSGARISTIHIRPSVAQRPQVDGAPSAGAAPRRRSSKEHVIRILGNGWSRVVSTKLPAAAADSVRDSALFQMLQPVSGPWGSGRVFVCGLFSALLTNHNDVLVGAVDPDVLYRYAAGDS